MWPTQDGDAGLYTVMFYVYDQKGGYDIDTMAILVTDDAPQLTDIPDTTFLSSDTLELDLNRFASDCNDPLSRLQWNVTGNVHLAVDITAERTARIFSPDAWTGTESITLLVRDPDENDASDGFVVTVNRCAGGTPGDVDANGTVNVFDVLTTVNFLLHVGELDSNAQCRADCNGDDVINVLDLLGIVNVILGIFPECPGKMNMMEIHPETIDFLKSLRAHFSPEDFEPLMAMLREIQAPLAFSILQNYPNPFNPVTTISYTIPVQSIKSKVESRKGALDFEPYALFVTLKIFNVMGQEVATLVDEEMEPGNHTATWDASDMASGVYFYRLTAGPLTCTKSMTVVK